MPRPLMFGRRSLRHRFLWTPLALGSTLVAWWDPATGVTQAGGSVSTWTDRVSGLVASQATAASQPTMTTLNSKPRLAFNGSQSLAFSGATLPQGTAVTGLFVAASCAATDSIFRSPFGYAADSHTARLFYANPTAAFANAGGPDNSTGISWANNEFFAEAIIDVSSIVTVLLDGTQYVNTALAQVPPGGSQAGGIGVWPSYGSAWVGTVAQILVTGTLTLSQRQKIEGWESWADGKAGSNLPASHPYKVRAPSVGDP